MTNRFGSERGHVYVSPDWFLLWSCCGAVATVRRQSSCCTGCGPGRVQCTVHNAASMSVDKAVEQISHADMFKGKLCFKSMYMTAASFKQGLVQVCFFSFSLIWTTLIYYRRCSWGHDFLQEVRVRDEGIAACTFNLKVGWRFHWGIPLGNGGDRMRERETNEQTGQRTNFTDRRSRLPSAQRE